LAVTAAGTRVAGAGSGVAFFLLTLFLAKQEKVSGCRAAPGYYVRRKTRIGPPKKKQPENPACRIVPGEFVQRKTLNGLPKKNK
jgi:hypothetical protein